MSSKSSKQGLDKDLRTLASATADALNLCAEGLNQQDEEIKKIRRRQAIAFFAIAVQAIYLIIML